MKISLRLKKILNIVPEGTCIADIGTDHGYVPIKAIKCGKVKRAIASDINEGPIKIAKRNIYKNNLENLIELRVGDGLSVLKEREADIIVIAGMGGNLISDIIKRNYNIASSCRYLVLQPMQYPEVLRKYLAQSDFSIKDEDITKEDGKFYHIILAQKGCGDKYKNEAYYYTGNKLVQKKEPVVKKYIEFKINMLKSILNGLPISYNKSDKDNLLNLKNQFEDVYKCL